MADSNPLEVPQNSHVWLQILLPVPLILSARHWDLIAVTRLRYLLHPLSQLRCREHSSCLINSWRSGDYTSAPNPRCQINFQYMRYFQASSPPAQSCSLIIRLEWFAINTSKRQLTGPKSALINGSPFCLQQWEPCGCGSTCVNW